MKTDQPALLFLNHVCGIHGDFCFQLRCPNEHVLVPAHTPRQLTTLQEA